MWFSAADALLWLAGAFLLAHVAMDVRALWISAHHPRDLLWTSATLIILGGHLVMDYVN